MSASNYADFVESFSVCQRVVHEIAKSKGWWDEPRTDGELIVLMHCELSEVVEAIRKGDPQSEKIPGFTQEEEEFADVVIRIMDYAEAKGLSIGAAIVAKMKHNRTRPHKHGGRKF